MSLSEKVYQLAPNFVQNLMVSLFNYLAYKKRYDKKYYAFLKHYRANNFISLEELKHIQTTKYAKFIKHSIANSSFYKQRFAKIQNPEKLENIRKLPVLNKEIIRKNLNDIYAISKQEAIISKTGGTTGKSLKVLFHKDDIQERFAILDNFRGKLSYKLGKNTAWFSGKNLLTARDLKKNRFWKSDFINNVRYYSTFHIQPKYLDYYIENLIKFKPEFMVGFPSTMYEIAKHGMASGIEFPPGVIKAIFPTAETITTDIRAVLESFFKTELYNQYASSEGAPFIVECSQHKLHLELQSGVYEVLDEKDNYAKSGRLVVTPFNTYGTPLIRYDIGDQIELAPDESCECGNNNPIVRKILGRISDYIFSPETGKINLGNISNCLKGVNGIIRFQITQNTENKLVVSIIKDVDSFSEKDETLFMQNLRDRIGNKMKVNIKYVSEIPVEKSGKYRLVKNNLK